MTSLLDQLRGMTTVVADTGDIDAIRRFKPVDCTTNPTLVLKAVGLPAYEGLLSDALAWGSTQSDDPDRVVSAVADRLAVAIGAELARIVPGRVSTEVDADLSFDTAASVEKARTIVAAYDAAGIGREKILIKIAGTYEGIRASQILQAEGIDTNMTLIFDIVQAVACAEAKSFLISPFVGRILDWHVKAEGRSFEAEEDPGVVSVRGIYDYYKAYGIDTVVMAASFRSTGEVLALAGCDRMTVSPALLEKLDGEEGTLVRRLDPASPRGVPDRIAIDEPSFRWAMNENAMATEKLAEGIRQFAKDLGELRRLLKARLRLAA
ncbi:MAG TPA: transaldolase [Methylomirabilota bacterium]|nr:transaldolase [Methylomirabilota bacterium]